MASLRLKNKLGQARTNKKCCLKTLECATATIDHWTLIS